MLFMGREETEGRKELGRGEVRYVGLGVEIMQRKDAD